MRRWRSLSWWCLAAALVLAAWVAFALGAMVWGMVAAAVAVWLQFRARAQR